jgi:hypothetical protein
MLVKRGERERSENNGAQFAGEVIGSAPAKADLDRNALSSPSLPDSSAVSVTTRAAGSVYAPLGAYLSAGILRAVARISAAKPASHIGGRCVHVAEYAVKSVRELRLSS